MRLQLSTCANIIIVATSVYIGGRGDGAYLSLFILSSWGALRALYAIPLQIKKTLLAEWRPAVVLLAGYVFSLFLSGYSKGGLAGLGEYLVLYSSVPLLFIAGVTLPFWDEDSRIRVYKFALLPLSCSLILSGLTYALSNSSMPASSLRPSEFVVAIGFAIPIVVSLDLFSVPPEKSAITGSVLAVNSKLIFLLALAVLGVLGVIVFRGAISTGLELTILFFALSAVKDRARLLCSSASVFMLALALIFSPPIRFTSLKIFLSSFSTGEGFSSRFQLFGNSLTSVFGAHEGIALFGPMNDRLADFWAHNTFIDLLLHEGLIPALVFVAFVISLCAITLYSFRFSGNCMSSLAVPFVLFLGSCVQPVQYSDGIAYNLSFLCIGFSLSILARDSMRHHEIFSAFADNDA